MLLRNNQSVVDFSANNNDDDESYNNYKPASQKLLSAWDIAMLEAKEILSENKQEQPSCFVPNTEKTLALVKDILAANPTPGKNPLLPLPIMNVGMPKVGSMTLFHFFDCIGLRTTHWSINTDDFEGLCMRDAAMAGLPPIRSCGKKTDAFLEFNVQYPFGTQGSRFGTRSQREECYFPQLSLLEEIHNEDPNVTFVINFRPIEDWIKSLKNWGKILQLFKQCNLPNLPRGLPFNVTDEIEVLETMSQFFCSHVQHLRNFVELHPSHALIELDLYDTEGSREILSSLFPSKTDTNSSECWGHENNRLRKKPEGVK